MSRQNIYINIVLLVIAILLTGVFVNWQISNELFFANETIGLALLSISLIFKLLKLKGAQYVLFFMMIILLFQLVKFSFTITEGDASTTYHSGAFLSIGFSPIVFVEFIFFILINRKVLFFFFGNLFYGYTEERKEKQLKKIDFYYNTFRGYSGDALVEAFKMLDDYPAEAQTALKQIKEERNII
jgi:hypothetical protein